MNAQKHTPGPWHRNGTRIFAQRNPGGHKTDIAEVFRDVGAQAAEANAHMIAAALALAEALEDMITLTENYNVGQNSSVIERARAALKEAGL